MAAVEGYLSNVNLKKLTDMKTLFLFALALLACGCTGERQAKEPEGCFMNPIFAGDYPDPSILRDGDDYYMVHSSFEYYPGLLIWHSTDLLNWEPVCNALFKYVGSVWAPEIVKHNGRYFIYFPVEKNNYVVYADNIEGPWSEPIALNIEHIDPGHVVDADGKRYLYFSSGCYVQLSDDGLSVVGELTHSYSGWEIPSEWSIELFALEGPKIFKRGDYYYMTVAEGGTAGPPTGHMIISARSKSALGPWKNSPYNPILRTQSLDERWASKGHGTLFDDTEGKSWIMYHAYEKGHYNMGRQTMLTPVEWTADGWFRIPDGVHDDKSIAAPYGATQKGYCDVSDDFRSAELNPQWKFFGEYDAARIACSDSGLTIKAKGTTVADCSPMLCVPNAHAYAAEVDCEIIGDAKAGMVMFYNNSFYSGILSDGTDILANLRGWQFPIEKDVVTRKLSLKLVSISDIVDMYYRPEGGEWHKIQPSLEVSGYHHNVLSGFMSLRVGLCSVGEGAVRFSNFRFTPSGR